MKHFKQIGIALTLAAATTANIANASEIPDSELYTETAVGAGTGAVVGTLVGGPAGFLVGTILGSVLGDELGETKQRNREQIDTLAQRDRELVALKRQLVSVEQERIRLAQTNRVLTRAEGQAERLDGNLSVDVLFRTGSGELEPLAAQRVKELATLLQGFPGVDIHLGGYADQRGSDQRNLELSKQRLTAVREALVRNGIPEARIHLEAHGEAKAQASADDLDGQALDRRVSIRLRRDEGPMQASVTE